MTIQQKRKPTRLQELVVLEDRFRDLQIGESDFEYRNFLETLRLRTLAEIKLEQQRLNQNTQVAGE
jgi:hypothetical protein